MVQCLDSSFHHCSYNSPSSSTIHENGNLSLSCKKYKNSSSSSTSIEDLSDDLLVNIFTRLPCESAFSCKCVSSRWLSLVSDPIFVAGYLNNKKLLPVTTKRTTATGEWTFLLYFHDKKTCDIDVHERPCTTIVATNVGDPTFTSPKFTLKFLPFCRVGVAATFKDLVLCHTYNQLSSRKEYLICNPVTMQWVSLPPSPLLPCRMERCWAGLVCEDPYDYDKDKGTITSWRNVDYRFRVVVVYPFPKDGEGKVYDPFANFNLIVFCSETRQWKQILLVVPTAHNFGGHPFCYFRGVVCGKMLYLRHNLKFGEFNPFDVTATSDSTLLARVIPLPSESLGWMYESEGQLFNILVRDMRITREELNPDNYNELIPVTWKSPQMARYDSTSAEVVCRHGDDDLLVEGIHPMNKSLVYLRLYNAVNPLVLCKIAPPIRRRRSSMEPLNLRIPSDFMPMQRLELQWWPTPIPSMTSSDKIDEVNESSLERTEDFASIYQHQGVSVGSREICLCDCLY